MLSMMTQTIGAADLDMELGSGETYANGSPWLTGDGTVDFYNSYFGNMATTDPKFVGIGAWVGLTDDQQRAAILGLTPFEVPASVKLSTPTVPPGPPVIAPPPPTPSILPPPNTPSLIPPVPFIVGEGPPPLVGPTGVQIPVPVSVLPPPNINVEAPVLSTIAAATQASATGPAAAQAPMPTPGSATPVPAAPAPAGMSTTTKILLGLLALLVVAKLLKD